jgi:hypothetical protein
MSERRANLQKHLAEMQLELDEMNAEDGKKLVKKIKHLDSEIRRKRRLDQNVKTLTKNREEALDSLADINSQMFQAIQNQIEPRRVREGLDVGVPKSDNLSRLFSYLLSQQGKLVADREPFRYKSLVLPVNTPSQSAHLMKILRGNRVIDVEVTTIIDGEEIRSYRRLSDEVIEKYKKEFFMGVSVIKPEKEGSDLFINELIAESYFELFEILRKDPGEGPGGMFALLNKSERDLIRYQISKTLKESLECNMPCLYYVLSQFKDIPTTLIPFLRGQVGKKQMGKIATILETEIRLKKWSPKSEKLLTTYYPTRVKGKPPKYSEFIEVGLVFNHYIIHELTEYKIKEFGGTSNRRITSTSLIGKMMRNGEFVANPAMIMFEDIKREDLRYIEHETREFDTNPKRTEKVKYICYADIETVDIGKRKHIIGNDGNIKLDKDGNKIYKKLKELSPWLYGAQREDGKECIYMDRTANPENCTAFLTQIRTLMRLKFVPKTRPKIIVYFHNAKFDFNLLVKCKSLTLSKPVYKGSTFYSVTITYLGVDYEIRDSYKMISCPLSDFKETFKLEHGKKECIDYKAYNLSTLQRDTISLSEVSDKIRSKLLKDPESLEFIDGDNYRHIDHMKFYHHYDITTLREGMTCLNDGFKKEFKLDSYDYLTISSLAHAFMTKAGAYDGVFEVSGGLLNYIQLGITGGRVCTRNNTKHYITETLNDLDAKSLYPSAMRELGMTTGLPTGAPTELTSDEVTNFDRANYTWYNLKIRVIKMSGDRQIPFTSIREKHKLNYTNNMEGMIIAVDEISLHDLIEMNNLEYEVIDGIYYTGEANKKIKTVIEGLYNKRTEYKKAGNDIMQGLIKLVMNSAYGKTLVKAPEVNISYHSEGQLDRKLDDDSSRIQSRRKLGDTWEVRCTAVPKVHYNLAPIGSRVLSMSKRIMNRVMALADEMNIKIFYQDTDSMHIVQKDIVRLEKAYNSKYESKLIGGAMGQFACDFADTKYKIHKEGLLSRRCIILAKKTYMDIVSDIHGHYYAHWRMKGVNKEAMKEFTRDFTKYDNYTGGRGEYDIIKQLLITKGKSVKEATLEVKQLLSKFHAIKIMGVYRDLYEDKTVAFNQMFNGKIALDINGGVYHKNQFVREQKFKGDRQVLAVEDLWYSEMESIFANGFKKELLDHPSYPFTLTDIDSDYEEPKFGVKYDEIKIKKEKREEPDVEIEEYESGYVLLNNNLLPTEYEHRYFSYKEIGLTDNYLMDMELGLEKVKINASGDTCLVEEFRITHI